MSGARPVSVAGAKPYMGVMVGQARLLEGTGTSPLDLAVVPTRASLSAAVLCRDGPARVERPGKRRGKRDCWAAGTKGGFDVLFWGVLQFLVLSSSDF